jgi:hypothetical protein
MTIEVEEIQWGVTAYSTVLYTDIHLLPEAETSPITKQRLAAKCAVCKPSPHIQQWHYAAVAYCCAYRAFLLTTGRARHVEARAAGEGYSMMSVVNLDSIDSDARNESRENSQPDQQALNVWLLS